MGVLGLFIHSRSHGPNVGFCTIHVSYGSRNSTQTGTSIAWIVSRKLSSYSSLQNGTHHYSLFWTKAVISTRVCLWFPCILYWMFVFCLWIRYIFLDVSLTTGAQKSKFLVSLALSAGYGHHRQYQLRVFVRCWARYFSGWQARTFPNQVSNEHHLAINGNQRAITWNNVPWVSSFPVVIFQKRKKHIVFSSFSNDPDGPMLAERNAEAFCRRFRPWQCVTWRVGRDARNANWSKKGYPYSKRVYRHVFVLYMTDI